MTRSETDARRVAVIGAGAAGMMAAVTAAEAGADVTLFERNDRVGKKLRITGKGRCNVTNNCDNNEFLSNVPTNPRFLYASLSRFSTADTMAFFENAGVPLKTERGKRVFPISDRAADKERERKTKEKMKLSVTIKNDRHGDQGKGSDQHENPTVVAEHTPGGAVIMNILKRKDVFNEHNGLSIVHGIDNEHFCCLIQNNGRSNNQNP